MLYNPNKTPTTVQLPKGRWNVCVTDQTAGTKPLLTVEGSVTVAPISTTALTLESVSASQPDSEAAAEEKKLPLLLGVTAAVTAAVGGAMAYLNHKRKKDKE